MYKNPQHPYTVGLLGSLPRLDETARHRLVSIEGMPPVLYEDPSFCPFASRCRYKAARCSVENPKLIPVGSEHRAACWVDLQTGKERQ